MSFLNYISITIFVLTAAVYSQSKNINFEKGDVGIGAAASLDVVNGPALDVKLNFKYHFTSKSAIRLSAQYSNSKQDRELEYNKYSPSDILENANLYGGSINYIYYIKDDKPVKLYLGGGSAVGKYKRTYKHFNPPDWNVPDDDYHSNYDQWFIGADGFAGLEWLVSKSIGITFEYTISLKHFWGTYDSYYVIEDIVMGDPISHEYNVIRKEGDKSSTNLYLSQLSLGINFYL